MLSQLIKDTLIALYFDKVCFFFTDRKDNAHIVYDDKVAYKNR